MQPRSRSPTILSSSSPIWWPSASLTLLNWSRSRHSTARHSPRLHALDLVIELLQQQVRVGEVGQRVVARHMRDPVLGALAFRDVLMGRQPAAAGIGLFTTEKARPSGKFTT